MNDVTEVERRSMSNHLEELTALVEQLRGLVLGTVPPPGQTTSQLPSKLITGQISSHLLQIEKLNDDLRMVIREAQLLK